MFDAAFPPGKCGFFKSVFKCFLCLCVMYFCLFWVLLTIWMVLTGRPEKARENLNMLRRACSVDPAAKKGWMEWQRWAERSDTETLMRRPITQLWTSRINIKYLILIPRPSKSKGCSTISVIHYHKLGVTHAVSQFPPKAMGKLMILRTIDLHTPKEGLSSQRGLARGLSEAVWISVSHQGLRHSYLPNLMIVCIGVVASYKVRVLLQQKIYLATVRGQFTKAAGAALISLAGQPKVRPSTLRPFFTI